MKVWITKYALTKGIFEIDAELCAAGSGEMIKEVDSRSSRFFHGKGKNWHDSKESAIKRAEDMKKAKIKSLHTQLNKLNKLTFN